MIPKASSGITTSVVLGTGRALGETMAVVMIMGVSSSIPTSLFSRRDHDFSHCFELGDYFVSPLTRHALFAIALVLIFMVLLLNLVITGFASKARDIKKHQNFSVSLPILWNRFLALKVI